MAPVGANSARHSQGRTREPTSAAARTTSPGATSAQVLDAPPPRAPALVSVTSPAIAAKVTTASTAQDRVRPRRVARRHCSTTGRRNVADPASAAATRRTPPPPAQPQQRRRPPAPGFRARAQPGYRLTQPSAQASPIGTARATSSSESSRPNTTMPTLETPRSLASAISSHVPRRRWRPRGTAPATPAPAAGPPPRRPSRSASRRSVRLRKDPRIALSPNWRAKRTGPDGTDTPRRTHEAAGAVPQGRPGAPARPAVAGPEWPPPRSRQRRWSRGS